MPAVRIRVPASTANLGPGFDCLGMALNLWNQADFMLEGNEVRVIYQEGQSELFPVDADNLILRAFLKTFARLNFARPAGLRVECRNQVPPASGMGSSAAAIIMGALAANALAGNPLSTAQLLELASEIEGHPDNISAALLGGLVISMQTGEGILARPVPVPAWQVVVVVPDFRLSTGAARAALPAQVPREHATFNLGRTALVIEALRSGDGLLLGKVMDDRLHQPYRLGLIPGALDCFRAARRAGANAVALSGAGPGVAAFLAPTADPQCKEAISAAMQAAFAEAELESHPYLLEVTQTGSIVEAI